MSNPAVLPWWQRWGAVIRLRKWWAIAGAVLAVVAAAVVASFARRRGNDVQISAGDPMASAVERFRERTTVANARAAVEITAARTKNAEVEAALRNALAEPDPKKQADALIALDEKVRAGR